MDAPRAFTRDCFRFADERRKSFLGLRELKCGVAAALGIRASKLVLAQMFSGVLEESGKAIEQIQVDESTFMEVLLPRVQKIDLLEQIRRDFKAFDLRAQGFISFASFQQVCSSVMPHMSHKTMFEIFREADRDGDGRVTYNDFEAICLLAEQVANRRQDPRPLATASTRRPT